MTENTSKGHKFITNHLSSWFNNKIHKYLSKVLPLRPDDRSGTYEKESRVSRLGFIASDFILVIIVRSKYVDRMYS